MVPAGLAVVTTLAIMLGVSGHAMRDCTQQCRATDRTCLYFCTKFQHRGTGTKPLLHLHPHHHHSQTGAEVSPLQHFRHLEQAAWKKKQINLKRIIGGKGVEYGEFPFIATLEIAGYFGFFSLCGGSAISTSVILTAAHCVQAVRTHPNRVSVVMGNHNLDYSDAHQENREVKKILIHEDYDSAIIVNDIALILLKTPFTTNKYRQTIVRCRNAVSGEGCQEADQSKTSWQPLQVLGWGLLAENGNQPDVLNKVAVPLIPHNECSAKVSPGLHPGIMCAGNLPYGGVDSCQGDSGGPLVHQNSNRSWELAGIVSYGKGCGRPSSPGFYTNVAYYREWIDAGLALLAEGEKEEGIQMMVDNSGNLFIGLSDFLDVLIGISMSIV